MSEQKQVSCVHGAASVADSFPFDQALILNELDRTLAAVSGAEVAVAQRMILAANRVFVTGAGRRVIAPITCHRQVGSSG